MVSRVGLAARARMAAVWPPAFAKRLLASYFAAILFGALSLSRATAAAAEGGIRVIPDASGAFHYADDFQTPRFLDDAFLDGLKPDAWQKGALTHSGPDRNRSLTYRFYGEHRLTEIAVQVDQQANGPNLGGTNALYVSPNGLDWTLVATSARQQPDANGLQGQPLTLPAEEAKRFIGRTEVWVRLTLDNYSGLKTNTSNWVTGLRVDLRLGEKATAAADPQASLLQEWGRMRRQAGWRSIALDWADPVATRPPHYYEDVDGWLYPARRPGSPVADEAKGFPVQRALRHGRRSPLSLSVFVRTRTGGRCLARLVLRCTRDSARKVRVAWNGKSVAMLDAGHYFGADRAFAVRIPGTVKAGVHELRITPLDSGALLVRQISVAGPADLAWAPKPALPPAGALQVLSATYLPDAAPPPASQAVEGRQKVDEGVLIHEGLQRLYQEHASFGALRVCVRNPGQTPVRIGHPLRLNGKPIEASYVDFTRSEWDAPGVVWYRVRPRLLPPGGCAEVYVRFRRRSVGASARLEIPLENGPALTVTIPYQAPPFTIDYVTTGASPDTLYVYVRHRAGAGRPAKVALDGVTLSQARLYHVVGPDDLTLAVARLTRPLRVGSYHVVSVAGSSGRQVAAQFRVLPFVFPRSSIHIPPEKCRELNMNLAMWYPQSLDTCRQHGVSSTTTDVFDLHEKVAYILGPDEPDAHDNRGNGYDRGLGANARELCQSGWQELIERNPHAPASWIIMNGTIRPLNWWVYGQLADIACFDPYPINCYGGDHAYVRESLSVARQAGAPRRLYACLETYGWDQPEGLGAMGRGPLPDEYRQNVVQALGVGAKGLTSWVYVASAAGWEKRPDFAREVAALNALIGHIEAELLIGTPVDLARSNAGTVPTGSVGAEHWPKERVWVGSLLCGPDALVVAAANHIPASKPEPVIEPARDVTLTVRLPAFLPRVTAFEVTEEGLRPFPCTVQAGQATLRVDAIQSGRIFVLRRQ